MDAFEIIKAIEEIMKGKANSFDYIILFIKLTKMI